MPTRSREARLGTHRAARGLASIVPGLVSACVGIALVTGNGWGAAGVPVESGGIPFGDLSVALSAAECTSPGSLWSLHDVPCNELTGIYNYPPIWATLFGLVGLGVADTMSVGIALILVFAASLSVLAYLAFTRVTVTRLAVMTLIGLTPPVLLGYQRGNIDLMVFGLLTMSVLAYARRLGVVSGVLMGLATALKLFPVGSTAALLLSRPTRGRALTAWAIISAVGIAWVARELPLISARTPTLDGASFGAAELPLLAMNRLMGGGSRMASIAIGWAVFLLALAAVITLARLSPRIAGIRIHTSEAWSGDPISASLFLTGAGAFLVAYLVGPSFDYRLIFLIPVIAGALRIGGRLSLVVASLLILQMLLSYSEFVGPAEYLSDLMLLVIVPAMLIMGADILLNARRMSRSQLAER